MPQLASWFRLGSPTSKMDPCPCPSGDSIAIVEKADVLQDQLADARSEKVRWLVQTVTQTHAELLKLPNLRPGKAINQLLGNLVSVCSEIHDRDTVEQVLTHPCIHPLLPSLRQICASAESCLELHWAEHILAGQDQGSQEVLARLKSFPYYANYEELTRLELCAILSATRTAPRRVAFLGSGPLPLTSLCLLQALKEKRGGPGGGDGLVQRMSVASGSGKGGGVQEEGGKEEEAEDPVVVLNVDYDEAAIAASLSLCLALGETGRGMEFICAEATSAEKDLAEFDVVYLAALVGMSQGEKESIILQVVDRMRQGALLVVRSSWGLRTCLYPEVDLATEMLLKRLEPCVVVHPYGQVVNSVIVARVRA
ncbi:putative nicotianamine synthase [Achaetomium macrosporum]|uniref:Nicotianamine synthase n=1 Tax=Achaetomium macrosporum TaxID=79813 RepID=A0AAN7C547_9PEZI|nr:putative nicotianamine synthase [Achaetomium macrosporum]